MTVDRVRSDQAPRPRGTYAQGAVSAGLLFTASQLPIDPATERLQDGSAFAQAERCLGNLDAVAQAAGTALDRAVRVTVYFADRAVMPEVDRAFALRFGDAPPARIPVHVASLAAGAEVSMDAIVSLS